MLQGIEVKPKVGSGEWEWWKHTRALSVVVVRVEEVTLSVRVGICNVSVFYHPAIYRSPSLMEMDERLISREAQRPYKPLYFTM